MLPDAPGRFSTTTGWFRALASPSARMRAATSGVDPPGKPTRIFSGRVGHGVAGARGVAAARGAAPAGGAVRGVAAGTDAAGRAGADAAGRAGVAAGCCASDAAAVAVSQA